MSNIGIDVICFSTSRYFLDLKDMAEHRNIEHRKYIYGICQRFMSVFPENEDIVTLGIDAAEKVMTKDIDKNSIDLLIFATESSFDLSKSAGIYIHHFLGLKNDCRVMDLKQACYSATAAIHLAKSHVAVNPKSKVLIVASDIVKYASGSSAEPSQGGGAVAMLISQDPRIMSIENFSGIHTEDVKDFWRPNASEEAFFDGKLSALNYLRSLDICWKLYLNKSNFSVNDIDFQCLHAPFGKMAIKGARQIGICKNMDIILKYSEIIGNTCSASLYLCFISLLDNMNENLSGKRIGLYSYGSGSVAEYFSCIVNNDYKKMLNTFENNEMLESRIKLDFSEYEKINNKNYISKNQYENIGSVSLDCINDGYRVYKKR